MQEIKLQDAQNVGLNAQLTKKKTLAEGRA
jgi:hypothetical protein